MTKLTREEIFELRRLESLAEFGPWIVDLGNDLVIPMTALLDAAEWALEHGYGDQLILGAKA